MATVLRGCSSLVGGDAPLVVLTQGRGQAGEGVRRTSTRETAVASGRAQGGDGARSGRSISVQLWPCRNRREAMYRVGELLDPR